MKTRTMAVMAVLALAFAGVAVSVDQNDAAVGDYQPVAYAKDTTAAAVGDYEGLRAVLYADKVLLLDTKDVRKVTALGDPKEYKDGLGGANEFMVTLQVANDSANALKIGPLSLENTKIYLDVSGNDLAGAALCDDVVLNITLSTYGNTDTLGNIALTCPSFTDKEAITAEVVLHTTHDASWTKAKVNTNTDSVTKPVYADISVDRNVIQDLTEGVNADFVDSTTKLWTLAGWAKEANGDVLIEPGKYTVEEIMYLLADGNDNQPITSAKIHLYAKWVITTYTLEILDQADGTSYKSEDAVLKVSSNVVAKASVTSEIRADSFALIRIVQDTTAGQYTYSFDTVGAVTKYNGTEWVTATLDTDYKVTKLANGLFKIYDVKADLRFNITAAASSAIQTTAYNLSIDQIEQVDLTATPDGVLDAGRVNLSMDLYDYAIVNPATPTEKISLNGTYYRVLDDETRVYGTIKNLGLDNTDNYRAYGDLVTDLNVKGKLGADHILSLSNDYRTYDLNLTLDDGYFIYAAQGFFDINGDGDQDTGDMYTPWSLFRF